MNEYRTEYRESSIPHNYRPFLHVSANLSMLIFLIIYASINISFDTYGLGSFLLFQACFLLLGNLAVYLIHRFPLHQYLKFFPYPYKVHTLMHHQYFTDKDIEFEDAKDWYAVFFPIIVVSSFTLMVMPLMYFINLQFFGEWVALNFLFGSALYFLLYEVCHFICHLPESSLILKLSYCRLIKEHHRVHHDKSLMQHYNFNIVFPLFDILFKSKK